MTSALWRAVFDRLGELVPGFLAWDARCGLWRGQHADGRWFTVRIEAPGRIVFVTGVSLDFGALAARHLGVERGVLLERIQAAGAGAVRSEAGGNE